MRISHTRYLLSGGQTGIRQSLFSRRQESYLHVVNIYNRMASGNDRPGKLDKLKPSAQLNCPICLEQYKKPRTLTCLHAFCEGCITSIVLKSEGKGSETSSVQCPLCRKETMSPAPNKPPAEWVRELPLNSDIVALLGVTESESTKLCGVCLKGNKQRPAQSFCIECNAFQCVECGQIHKYISAIEHHKLLGLEEAETFKTRSFNLGKAEYCSVHAEKKLEFFCEDHNMCCCSTCAIVKHRNCKTVTEIREFGKTFHVGEKLQQLSKQMVDIEKELCTFTDVLDKNMSEITQQAVDIPQQIKDFRQKIVQMLDQLVEDVTLKCGQLKKQQTTDLEDKMTSIRSQEAAVTSSRSVLEALTRHGTETQTFVAFHQFQEHVNQYQTELETLRHTLTTVNLQLTVCEELNSFMKCTTTLAEVTVQQPQRHVIPISECEVTMSDVVNIGTKRNMEQATYTGAAVLRDGRPVVTDYHNQLCCLLDNEYNVLAKVKLPSYPRGMTVIGQSDVVVVIPDINTLQRVSITGTGLTLNRTIHCTRKARCVSTISDTELAVGWDQGLSIIDLNGTEQLYMDKDSTDRQIRFCENSHLLVDTVSSRLYQSSWGAQAVYGMKMTGKALFTYNNNLRGPAGLALDRDRNIYVCSYHTRSVHQISPDGQSIRIINVKFNQPYTIFFDHTGTHMAVMQCFGTTKAVKVTFEPASKFFHHCDRTLF